MPNSEKIDTFCSAEVEFLEEIQTEVLTISKKVAQSVIFNFILIDQSISYFSSIMI